jgi:hypothetical protein
VINIGWTPYDPGIEDSFWRDTVLDKPERLNTKPLIDGGLKYCPAFRDFWKNTFVVRMPFDMSIVKIGPSLVMGPSNNIHANKLPESFLSIERDDTGVNAQVMLNNMFVSDVPHTMIETLPPILHGCRDEIVYLNGKFDCHAWQRPLQFGFRIPQAIVDEMTPENGISLDKGEPVMYIRFSTVNDDTVKLHQLNAEDVEQLSQYVHRNTQLPRFMHSFSFKEIINRVRNRRPTKFVRTLHYGESKKSD